MIMALVVDLVDDHRRGTLVPEEGLLSELVTVPAGHLLAHQHVVNGGRWQAFLLLPL